MNKVIPLDREWIELIKEAKDQGFTKEEVVEFLKNPTVILDELYTLKIANS